MATDDRRPQDAPEEQHPIDPPVGDDERYQLEETRREKGGVTDVGKTSGGGSLGHVQPERVEREAPLRNNPEAREDDEPALPSNDATLKTKI